jgi:menaquinone-dependent protoporphyrinogen oxidase
MEVLMNNVLVAYASKYGATAEIARKIGDVLREAGLPASVLAAENVRDVSSYDAVVLGSAVYAGHWLKEAVALLESNEKTLAMKPVWFFSSGPTGDGDPVDIMHGWRFPEAQQSIADRIQPKGITFFHGKIDLHNLHFTEKLMMKAVRAKVGDFRDWESISVWAKQIVTQLQPRQEVVTT